MLCFWISSQDFGGDNHWLMSLEGVVVIERREHEEVLEEDFWTAEKGLSKKNFWARGSLVGPFKTQADAEAFLKEVFQEEIVSLQGQLEKFKNPKIILHGE